MLISSLTPTSGRAIGLSPLTALVGPNNAGKTTLLRDILALLTHQYMVEQEGQTESNEEIHTLVVDDLDLNSQLAQEDLLLGLRSQPKSNTETVLQGVGPDGCTGLRVVTTPDTFKVLHRPRLAARAVAKSELAHMLPLRVSLLSLEDRLQATNSDVAGSPLETPANLLQLLQLAGSEAQSRLNEACQTIFGGDPIWLDDSEMIKLSLRLGHRPSDDELPSDLADRAGAIQRHRLLDDEGQGLRSCVAILANVILGAGRVLLLDQPELFLHPAQAMRLGRWLSRQAPELRCQIVAATHSAEFLTGLIHHGASQTAILRLRRGAESTDITRVDSTLLDPVVETACDRRQLLAAMFSDGAILVDNSDDCRIVEHMTHRHLGHTQVAVAQCHDPSLLGQIAGMLREAALPTAVCSRFSVMEKKNRFVNLVNDITGKDEFPTSWQGVREKIARHVEQQIDPSAMASNTREMEQFLDSFNSGSDTEVSTTLPTIDGTSRWSELIAHGVNCLPSDLQAWVIQMLEELKVQGIFVVPQGTVANWWEDGTQSKSLNRQLIQLDEGNCPPELREFVTNMNDYLVVQTNI